MKWDGKSEFVVGEVDENNNVIREFRIKPGEEFPAEAIKLIKADEYLEIDHKGNYSRELVKKHFVKLNTETKGEK